MRITVFFILILLFLTASCQTNTVLICKGTSSYAYHDKRCEGLNRCRAAIEKVSVSKAKSIGRIPCQYCYAVAAPVSIKQTARPSVQGQCTAITKKGTQCSRSARSQRRCWQHGG